MFYSLVEVFLFLFSDKRNNRENHTQWPSLKYNKQNRNKQVDKDAACRNVSARSKVLLRQENMNMLPVVTVVNGKVFHPQFILYIIVASCVLLFFSRKKTSSVRLGSITSTLRHRFRVPTSPVSIAATDGTITHGLTVINAFKCHS